MQIDVIASVNEARSDDMAGKTVLVIDVLRATSNMVTGLANGALGIVPVETVQQAKALQAPGDLLGGERYCKRLAGFDLGNSPFEYMSSEISGRRIVMTTTNGTRAIQKTGRAQSVFACSFLNAAACAEAVMALGRSVLILCAGTQDVFSLEDGLCAGMVIEELRHLNAEQGAEHGQAEELQVNDFGLAMHASYCQHRLDLTETLLHCSNGKRLAKLGFEADISYCARRNIYDFAPLLLDGILVVPPVTVRG